MYTNYRMYSHESRSSTTVVLITALLLGQYFHSGIIWLGRDLRISPELVWVAHDGPIFNWLSKLLLLWRLASLWVTSHTINNPLNKLKIRVGFSCRNCRAYLRLVKNPTHKKFYCIATMTEHIFRSPKRWFDGAFMNEQVRWRVLMILEPH